MPKIAVSLFDYTGNMLIPWRNAGYDCFAVDIQYEEDKKIDGINRIKADLTSHYVGIFGPPPNDIAFVSAFPPCTDLSVSGAKHFKDKGLRRLANSIEMFATAVEFCEMSGAPYMIENPVSTISTYWRQSDYKFHPCHYTAFCLDDNYTKETHLWTGGGFVMPDPSMDTLEDPDDRIHKAAPGPDRANFRSATPMGFAKAVFEANKY